MLHPETTITPTLSPTLGDNAGSSGFLARSPLSDPLTSAIALSGRSASAIAFVDVSLSDYQTLVQGFSAN